jgi:hypothetical protein
MTCLAGTGAARPPSHTERNNKTGSTISETVYSSRHVLDIKKTTAIVFESIKGAGAQNSSRVL